MEGKNLIRSQSSKAKIKTQNPFPFLPQQLSQSKDAGTEGGCHSTNQDWAFSHLLQALPTADGVLLS